jgi:hypothetical protein
VPHLSAVDIVCDSTGAPEASRTYALAAFDHGKHVAIWHQAFSLFQQKGATFQRTFFLVLRANMGGLSMPGEMSPKVPG